MNFNITAHITGVEMISFDITASNKHNASKEAHKFLDSYTDQKYKILLITEIKR